MQAPLTRRVSAAPEVLMTQPVSGSPLVGGDDGERGPVGRQAEVTTEPLLAVILEVVECCSHNAGDRFSMIVIESFSHTDEVEPQAYSRLWRNGQLDTPVFEAGPAVRRRLGLPN